MTVAELIQRLQTFDPNLPVLCGPNGYDSEQCSDPTPGLRIKVLVNEWDGTRINEAVVL